MATDRMSDVVGLQQRLEQHGFIAESANIQELDPAFADMNIIRKRRDNVKLHTVMSNSFGFGGTNATLVFTHVDA